MSTPMQTIPGLAFDGQIDNVQMFATGPAPTTVISSSENFSVKLDWSVSGSAVPLIGGTWSVRALVESIGEGFEGQIGATNSQALTGANAYTATINVPAGTLPNPNVANQDTVYKLVVIVSHVQFGVKTLIAGFGEGPYFEIEKP
jgi:hypothetical protein